MISVSLLYLDCLIMLCVFRRSISPYRKVEREASHRYRDRRDGDRDSGGWDVDMRDRDLRDSIRRVGDHRDLETRDRDLRDSIRRGGDHWNTDLGDRDLRDRISGDRDRSHVSPTSGGGGRHSAERRESSYEGQYGKRPRFEQPERRRGQQRLSSSPSPNKGRWNASPPPASLSRRAPSPSSQRRRRNSSDWSPTTQRSTELPVAPPGGVTAEVSMLSALRLMSGLEPTGLIRDLGPQVDLQLAAAIGLENRQGFGSSLRLVDTKETYLLFTDVRGRLQNRMMAGSGVTEAEKNVCRIIIDQVTILLQRSSLRPEDFVRKQPVEAPPSSVAAPVVDETERFIKLAIARSVDQQLTAAGRAVSQAEFAALVEAEYIRLKNQLPSQLTAAAAAVTAAPAVQAAAATARTARNADSPPQQRPLARPPAGGREVIPAAVAPSKLSPRADQVAAVAVPPSMPLPPVVNGQRMQPATTVVSCPAAGPSMAEPSVVQKPSPPSSATTAGLPPAAETAKPPPTTAAATAPAASATPALPNIDWNSLSIILKTVNQAGTPGPLSAGDVSGANCSMDDMKEELMEEEEEEEEKVVVKIEADPFDDLTDEELVSLLTNFKTLSQGDQQNLVCYMKKMEQEDPQRVQRLKEETARARRRC